jgi:hypothetical protein
MKHKKYSIRKFLIISIFLLSSLYLSPQKAHAAALTAVKDRMNRMEDSLASGVEHNFIFTTATVVEGGAGANFVRIEFPAADDTLWCRTADALVATGITSDPSHSGVITALPGTLAATCTQGGGGTSDIITISGVNNLAAATVYGVNVDDTGAGALGTPTTATTGITTLYTRDDSDDIDSGSFNLEIVDDDTVHITATVPPTLTCSLDTLTVAFGTLSVGAPATNNSLTISIETNAGNGYAWIVYDVGSGTNPGLYDSGTTSIIGSANDAYANDAVNLTAVEGYGAFMSDPGANATVDARYDGGATTDVGGFEVGTDSSIAAIIGAASTTVAETSDVTFVVNITASTPAGSYVDDVTFVCVGRF